MANVSYSAAVLEMGEVEASARTLGLDTAKSEITDIARSKPAIRGVAFRLMRDR
jgi:hypothetical protein